MLVVALCHCTGLLVIASIGLALVVAQTSRMSLLLALLRALKVLAYPKVYRTLQRPGLYLALLKVPLCVHFYNGVGSYRKFKCFFLTLGGLGALEDL